MARYPKTVDAAAKNKNTRVHGIDAANGKRGDTKTQNSTTKSGKKIQVDICVPVSGGAKPFTRLGRPEDIVCVVGLKMCTRGTTVTIEYCRKEDVEKTPSPLQKGSGQIKTSCSVL
jgi:hypothetical protein